MTIVAGDLAQLIDDFQRDGYVILEGVYTDEQVAEFHRLRDQAVHDWCYVTGTAQRPEAVGDLLERFPQPVLNAITDPLVLGLGEALMGPVVQLDSAVLVGATTVDVRQRGRPVAWHRDRFGFFPIGAYTPPQAIAHLAYLQDLTADVGPLRVIPGSHREPIAIALSDRLQRHPHEVLLRPNPGDVVALHHNLLHSGTRNVSVRERRFFGFTFTETSRSQEDDFDGPNCRALAATARRTRDRRLLRLLGNDPLVDPRQNTGFIQPATEYWSTWHAEDEQYAASAAGTRAEVSSAREALR